MAGNGDTAALPFVAPCRTLEPTAPLRWLVRGGEDLRHAPLPGLALGAVLTALSYAIAWGTLRFGTLALYLGLATGFVFVGPLLAVGFYVVSRDLEAGRTPSVGRALRGAWAELRELALFGVVLLVVLLLWARAATVLHIFYPVEAGADWRDMLPFLGIGSAVGAVFAAIVFAVSAFSLPMLLDREVDAITAVVTSINATLRNGRAMLLWGLIVVAGVLVGFATALAGFVVVLPIIGHATWHAYRETIDASKWPSREPY